MSEHKYISLKDILRNQPMQELKLREPKNKGKNHVSDLLVSSEGSFSDISLASSCESPAGEDEDDDNDASREKNTRTHAKKNKDKCTQFPSVRLSKSDNSLLYTGFCGSCSSEDDLKLLSLEMRNFSWEDWTLRSNIYISQSEEEASDNEEEEEEDNN